MEAPGDGLLTTITRQETRLWHVARYTARKKEVKGRGLESLTNAKSNVIHFCVKKTFKDLREDQSWDLSKIH